MRVLVFGASITQGFWDVEGGWVNRLRRYYDNQVINHPQSGYDYPTVFNLGISGDTTRGVIKRLKNETNARVWPGEKLAFIFCIGTNNTLIKSDGTYLSTPQEYRTDLMEIIKQAKEFSDKILLVELPPCDEDLTQPVSWTNVSYTNDRIALFNNEAAELAAAEKLPFVEVFKEFKSRFAVGGDLFADGLHPNDAGHELIFQLVRPQLDKLLA